MNILYHHRIASKDGQYVHVEELTKAFKELGHKLDFVAPYYTNKADFGSDGGIVGKLKNNLPSALYEILELSYSLVIAIKLIKSILINKPDFIYERYNLYQPAGVIIAKFFRIPLLLEVNAPLVDERNRYSGLSLRKLAGLIENFTWKRASLVLPVTQVLAKIIQNTGVSVDKIHVIHNGIDNKLLQKHFKEKEKFNKDRIVIGFVGFINPWHRLDLAIDALVAHKEKNIHLICVGDGDIRSQLENKAEELGIKSKVTFTGQLPRSEVFRHIKNFDIALQPSVTPYASPLKLFEYLAASCLIIAPRTDNICEILSDKNALLFELGNYHDFSEKLSLAIDNLEGNTKKRIEARKVIFRKKLTWQENVKRIVYLVERM